LTKCAKSRNLTKSFAGAGFGRIAQNAEIPDLLELWL